MNKNIFMKNIIKMDYNNQKNNNELNDSIFQEEGEYLIEQKPKYKYEIKIIHDPNLDQEKGKIKSKTPDKIISSSKLSFLNKPKKNFINNKNNIINKPKNSIINKNNNIINKSKNDIINNNKNINISKKCNIDEHYDNYYNNSNYNFYTCDSSSKYQTTRNFYDDTIPQAASEIKILSKTSNNFYNPKNNNNYANYNNYKYINNNNKNISNKKQCTCQKEFNKIIHDYFSDKKNTKQYNCNYNINTVKMRKTQYNMNKKYNNESTYQCSSRKKYFKEPLQIEKSIEKTYKPTRNNKTPINILNSKKNNIYYNNKIYTDNSCSKKNNKKVIKNIYKKNIYIKNIDTKVKSNQYLYTKNNKIKAPDKTPENIRNMPSNYSFISINDSKNKAISPYNSTLLSRNNTSQIKSNNQSYINNNDSSFLSKNNKKLMIHKSSERKEKIKSLPHGQKIKPLVVKKTVKKPIIEKITKEDGTIMNVMRQTTIVTSIETKPLKNMKRKNKNDENLVKECITNIYTTLTKNLDDNEDKELIKNKSFETINYINNSNNSNKKRPVFVKRKIMDKRNINQNNLSKNKSNQKETKTNDINNNNNKKKNYNINISEISNDLLKHKTTNSSINNSSLISYEQSESNYNNNRNNNNGVRMNKEIKNIKYQYYRCINLNSTNQAKVITLSDYFLKLTDEEKIGILTNLNDGNPENIKIYKKLINILKEKRLENENRVNINNKNNRKYSDEKFMNDDYNENKQKTIKNLNKANTNILFKKKIIGK